MFPPEYLEKLLKEDPNRAERIRSTQGRFEDRVEHFEENRAQHGRRTILPKTIHHFWWVVHNAVAHPLIAIAPVKPFFAFHDYTSDKINGKR